MAMSGDSKSVSKNINYLKSKKRPQKSHPTIAILHKILPKAKKSYRKLAFLLNKNSKLPPNYTYPDTENKEEQP